MIIIIVFLMFMYSIEAVCVLASGQIEDERTMGYSGSYDFTINNTLAESTDTPEKSSNFISFISSLFSWLTFTAVEGTPLFISIFLTFLSMVLWTILILLIINMVTHFIPFVG